MKRAVLVVLLAGCTSSSNDYPTRPGGGGPVIIGGGGGGPTGDAGTGDAVGDGGVTVTARLCIVSDLRKPTSCDTTKDASVLAVALGTRHPDATPAKTGEFTIFAQLGTDLVWQVTGTNFITTVMPYGTDNTIPVLPDVVYLDLLRSNSVTINAQGQGSVLVSALSGGTPASGVTGTSTLISSNVTPRYDEDNSAVDWREIGPTQSHGILWFPGVQVTTTPARVTLKTAAGASLAVDVNVVDQAITFVTADLQ